jgi:hypothetical protein
MSYVHPAWLEYQRRRFERHDAHRFIKPEPVQRKSYAERMVEAQRAAEEEERIAAEQDAFEREVLALRREWAELKLEYELWRLGFKALHPPTHDPSQESEGDPSHHSNRQPRVPAGSSDGGQWTEEGGTANTQFAQVGSGITDAFGQPYYQPGGHHEMSKGVYGKWKLQPETLKIFKEATTGSIPLTVRTSPDGTPIGNTWNEPHRAYNKAIQELGDRFLDKNGIRPENMTPDQARSLLKEIRESEDRRIRGFNDTMRLLRRIYRLRGGGRGIE